ncbi:hypothetical protein M0802_008807 [Mischocyttarus mexicanus]|nr:hypothetical protein M0802_008807 [Mischocyttarus mexicanus]
MLETMGIIRLHIVSKGSRRVRGEFEEGEVKWKEQEEEKEEEKEDEDDGELRGNSATAFNHGNPLLTDEEYDRHEENEQEEEEEEEEEETETEVGRTSNSRKRKSSIRDVDDVGPEEVEVEEVVEDDDDEESVDSTRKER